MVMIALHISFGVGLGAHSETLRLSSSYVGKQRGIIEGIDDVDFVLFKPDGNSSGVGG